MKRVLAAACIVGVSMFAATASASFVVVAGYGVGTYQSEDGLNWTRGRLETGLFR